MIWSSTSTKRFFIYLIPGWIGIWKCLCLGREENGSTRRKPLGAKERTNKKLNPVYQNGVDARIWTCMGHIGGRQVLPPLCHPLLPMLLPNCNENSNSYVKKKNIFTSSEFQGLSELLIALTRNLFPWVSSHNISCKENEKYFLHQYCIIIFKKISYPQKQ